MTKNTMHNANETANKDGTTNGNTINYDLLAKKTDGYSGADIRLVAKEAAMRPLRRLMSKLEQLNLNDSTDNDGISSKKLIDALDPIKVEDVVAALNCT